MVKIQLAIILALVCIIVFMVFMIMNAKKAINLAHTENTDLDKKLQQVTFDLQEAERKGSNNEDEIMDKLSEQEKQLAETEKNFKHALNSKNEYITQLTLRLKEYESASITLVNRVKMLMEEVDRLRASNNTPDNASSSKQADNSTIIGSNVSDATNTQNNTAMQLKQPVHSDLPSRSTISVNDDGYDSVSEPSTFPSSMFSTSVKETVIAEHVPIQTA